MNATITLPRTAALVAGAFLALASARAAADTDAMPVFSDNYVKVIGTAPFSNGSSAGFNRRMQFSHDGAGGIADLRYSQEVSKETSWELDGRVLPGAGDYLGEIKLTKNEVGSIDVGYKRFRTFYDGMGGFFPTNNAWITLYPRERYVDRAKFFANATIELPNRPVFTFKYSNELRNGTKDSTIWGDTDFTGIPIYSQSALNPVTSTRKLLPAYLQLGERQQTWEASVRQTFGKSTTASLSIIGTDVNNLDSRSVDRYTFEIKPFPAIPSNPLSVIPPNLANNPNHGFDVQGFKETALTYLAKIETKLSERNELYFEASFRHATGDTTASRLINVQTLSAAGLREAVALYTAGGRPAYSYTSTGTLDSDVFTGVIGWRTMIGKNLRADFALRGEDYKVKADSSANYVANLLVAATGVVTPVNVPAANWLDTHEKPWTPAVDLRYTGIKSLSLYGSWDYRTMKQDEKTSYAAFTVNTSTGGLTAPISLASDAVKEKHQNIKVGANWSPAVFLNIRPEFFTKDHENRFEGYGVSAGGNYILDYDIYGAKLSVGFKPLTNLGFNTRYIVQRGKAAMSETTFTKGDTNDARRYSLGETVDWTPNKNIYVQGSVNLVYDTIRTSNPRVTGLARTVVANSDNNYWNGSLVTSFVLTKVTDASIQATYYKANNYNPSIAAYAEPFGAGGKEYTVSVGVKHKFSDRVVGSAKVGYFDSHNVTTGSNTDFHGPLAYLAVERSF